MCAFLINGIRTINCNLYYNYEKYPLSPLKPRSLALIDQYLPNISDPMYSVHQSFMWFLWLNWRKSTFYPVTAPNDSKCWPIVTSSIQGPVASNCDATMTDCSRVVAMDAFLAYFMTPVFQRGASLVFSKVRKWWKYMFLFIKMQRIQKVSVFLMTWLLVHSHAMSIRMHTQPKCEIWLKKQRWVE